MNECPVCARLDDDHALNCMFYGDGAAASPSDPAPPDDDAEDARETLYQALGETLGEVFIISGQTSSTEYIAHLWRVADTLADVALGALADEGYEVRRVAAAVPPTDGETE